MLESEKIGRRETLIITSAGLWVGYFLVAFLVRYVVGGQWKDSLSWIFYMDWKNYVPVIITLVAALVSGWFIGKKTGRKIFENPSYFWWMGILTAVTITLIALCSAWLIVWLMELSSKISSFNDMAEESYVYLVFLFIGLIVFLVPAILLGLLLGFRIKSRLSL